MLAEMENHLYSVCKPKSFSKILGLEKTAMEFCASLIFKYLRMSGIQIIQGQTMLINDCLALLKIQSKFKRMFHFFLSFLSQVGMVALNEGKITFLELSCKLLPPEALLGKIRTLYPKFHFFFTFLEKCVDSYPEVFSGRKSATEVLFPSDNPFILKKIYENTPKIGHEDLYLHLLKEYLRNRLKMESTLIEIGGGQGILTQILLPELHENLEKYLFTDIGTSFLKDASVQWSHQFPKLNTALFNASLDPQTQGYVLNSFDALVGFNVVHTTHDIIQTIKQCAKLVHEKGVICLIETVRQQAWIDMIYGLTDGWWLFNDPIRSNSPLLSIEQWELALTQCEYNNFVIFPTEKEKRIETDTALIVIEMAKK